MYANEALKEYKLILHCCGIIDSLDIRFHE